jgi:hypothetical protein
MLVCLTMPLFVVQFTNAAAALHVNEAATRFFWQEDRTSIALAVENPTSRTLVARVKLELLDPRGNLRASAERDETLKRGQAEVVIPLPLKLDMENQSDRNELLWYRLRYRITPASGAEANATEGIVSLSEITLDIFDLRVVAPPVTRAGMRCRAQVSALHPISARPVAGVSLEGQVEFSDDQDEDRTLKVNGVTNDEGYALLDFDLPRNIDKDDSEIELKVTARRGDFVQEAEDEIELDDKARILLTTDKPLYQPGQALHIRALVFDSTKRAMPDTAATLTITDPEGSTVYNVSLKTSRFGIASAEWPIPENTRLGDYAIRLEIDDDSDSLSYETVKISRYDLPNFTVRVKPDHPYYLAGQQAEVEVRADYLFGQPVKRGRVRVVRETARNWNYREQKWETKEAEKYEGETNADGSFIAHLNLQKEHDELAGEDYSRFHDLTYAAYFTDPTTNRTEQRRFDLRLTKDAIHIYINETSQQQAANFPFEFYVSTFYADGAPAECDVVIADSGASNIAGDRTSGVPLGETLRTIRTNRYGLAKVSELALADRVPHMDAADLSFTARDAKGGIGRQSNAFSFSSSPVLRVETDKILYRKGEPIRAQLRASQPQMRAAVNVLQRGVVVHSEVVQLSEGRAELTLPYNAEFKDDVTVAAYPLSNAEYSSYRWPMGTRTVLYPRDRDLKLSVRLNQPEYRPGEEAQADFSIRAPDGRTVESALGIVIFDRAVEERARTNQEFGRPYGFSYAYRYLRGDSDDLAGFSRKDLERLDPSKPLSSEMALVAEMLLGNGESYAPNVFGGNEYETDQRDIFERVIEKQIEPLSNALYARYARSREYPADDASLRRLLSDAGVKLESVRDPWAMNFRTEFFAEREQDVLAIKSAGADKRFGTADDFTAARLSWPYFQPLGEIFNRAAEKYHARTGGYIRDETTLRTELEREGLDTGALRDRWGQPYNFQFDISGMHFIIRAGSGGANGRFENGQSAASDDFTVWTVYTDYFADTRVRIDNALTKFFNTTGRFPHDEMDLRQALSQSGIDRDSLRDAWGRPYSATFATEMPSGYSYVPGTYYLYSESGTHRTEAASLVPRTNVMRLHSLGRDGKDGTGDDFQVAGFSSVQTEQSARQLPSRPNQTVELLPGSTGAISGKVLDPTGATVPGAKVTATRMSISRSVETETDAQPFTLETETNDEGVYLLRNLPVGVYRIEISASGFSFFAMEEVPVKSSSMTKADGTLSIAGVAETVTVTAGAAIVNATQSQISQLHILTNNFSAEFGKNTGAVVTVAAQSTPRLREYFPETLVWQPSLETDAEGRARLNFKLADNITTWKLSVIGSTIDGEVGMAEQEIRAFQPFFVEHDPPRVLTEGDQIQLPVILRNYLDQAQTVDVEIKPEKWFALTGASQLRETVAAGDATRAIFNFRAVASVTDGKQRITAQAADANDAIEKPVSVHPDGEELTLGSSQFLNETAELEVNFPAETIAGSAVAELKIYPNLMAHVIEGIEGNMQRPYGCGEQTISSTYPSLLALKLYKRSGVSSPVAAKAERYLHVGYERLLNYRVAGGGFTYWGQGDADLALTAYAFRFLSDAEEFTTVDQSMLLETRNWLIKQQHADGSWPVHYYLSEKENATRTAMLTAYIARVLAMSGRERTGDTQAKAAAQSLTSALNYLQQRAGELNEPYLIAAYALAALDAKDSARARPAIEKLRVLAQSENDMSFWPLAAGTPFYGWGLAGRIEATALAVQALTRFAATEQSGKAEDAGGLENGAQNSPHTTGAQARRGLLYLLRNKDRYGVWYSTQATVNALDALISTMAGRDAPSQTGTGEAADILINGRHATEVMLPPANQLSAPLSISLTPYLAPGNNHVLIRRHAGGSQAAVQVVQTYYVPWDKSPAVARATAASRALRLAVSYDKTEMEVGAEVTCKVEAERMRPDGYGMLLAEIGLPPGADVDRASLELAMKAAGWSLSRYDILPDRLIVYLWPRTGGMSFEFKFRPRFGLTAQTAPSVIYDYYNPEARSVIVPTKFQVK